MRTRTSSRARSSATAACLAAASRRSSSSFVRARRPIGRSALEGPERDRAHDERDQRLGTVGLDARTLRPRVQRLPVELHQDVAGRQAERIEQDVREVVEHAIGDLAGQELGREVPEEPGLALPPGRAVAVLGRTPDQETDDQRDHEEHDRGHHVLGAVELQREPLGPEQERQRDGRDHRRQQAAPEPSGDRRDHAGQQEHGDRAGGAARASGTDTIAATAGARNPITTPRRVNACERGSSGVGRFTDLTLTAFTRSSREPPDPSRAFYGSCPRLQARSHPSSESHRPGDRRHPPVGSPSGTVLFEPGSGSATHDRGPDGTRPSRLLHAELPFPSAALTPGRRPFE